LFFKIVSQQNILQCYFSTKWIQSSYRVSRVQIIIKVESETKTKTRHICMDQNYTKKLQGLKPKRDIFASRADSESNQLENNSILDSINDSLNLVHEPNEPNLN